MQTSLQIETRQVATKKKKEAVVEAAPTYFPTLDGLRFVAFFLVFIHHYKVSGAPKLLLWFQGHGWVGVHLFFGLSGYLLTTILCAEHTLTGRISVPRFFIRRALRIWPLYFFFVVGIYAVCVAKYGLHYGGFVRFLGLVFFVDNIFSGFLEFNPIPYMAALWTISLEEQFYLVLPFVMREWLTDRSAIPRRIFGIWLFFVAMRVLFVLMGAPYPMIWTSIFSADSLLFGALLGVINWQPRSWLERIGCFGLGVFGIYACSFFTLHSRGPDSVFIYMPIAVGAGLLCLSLRYDPIFRFMGIRPLRYLGKISYGLYVYHFVGIALAGWLMKGTWMLGKLIAFPVALLATIAIAAASYQLIERPFLRLKVRFETVRTRPV